MADAHRGRTEQGSAPARTRSDAAWRREWESLSRAIEESLESPEPDVDRISELVAKRQALVNSGAQVDVFDPANAAWLREMAAWNERVTERAEELRTAIGVFLRSSSEGATFRSKFESEGETATSVLLDQRI